VHVDGGTFTRIADRGTQGIETVFGRPGCEWFDFDESAE